MRPGQNKRMRGRNNNRKGPNPLTRSYESNGPDVKIRGTAHHIAEKYLQLARDAQSSGDPVAAEGYLQHAEHYFRLIASAQQAQMGYPRPAEEAEVEEGDEDDLNALPDRFASPPERTAPPFNPQQSYPERQPYGGDRQPYNGERQNFNGERPQSQDRQDRGGYDRQQRGDRPQGGRGPRPYRDQDNRNDNRGPDNRGPDNRNQESRGPDFRSGEYREGGREQRPGRDHQGGRGEQPGREQPFSEKLGEPRQAEPVNRQPEAVQGQAPGLPAFITAPVRVNPAIEEPNGIESEANGHEAFQDAVAEEAVRFPRRRRRPRPVSTPLEGGGDVSGEVPPGEE